MSRISHLTSARIVIPRGKQEQKKIPINEKVFSVMNVMVLNTLDQNVPRISRNKRVACLFLRLMILKVKLMMKLLSMLQCSLVDMNLMKILVMRMSLMKNWLLPTKICVRSEEVCETGEEQKRIIAQLQAEKEKRLSTVTDLENELYYLLNLKIRPNP